MKNLFIVLLIASLIAGCNTYRTSESGSTETAAVASDTVIISSDKVEYEIIIIEPGFNSWLMSRAKPRGYYEQSFLESRNIIYVTEWNNRVLNPTRYDPQLYEWQINYERNIDYGYEVNYLLYYYFIYFQRTYNQRLSGFVPRI
ncbi:MAG: hypothetical protein HKN00_09490 [Flavobacteriaceae bacterium]|nr:hypothetical protein [Bacteroidia bacterium]MBT8287767.1 hypothetical protein [Bacteroidia bacterium]NNF75405.1 hypothetical protein [Flavobacteriaceae bacterium]NNK72239.1 hypothetical protein [Flavobacteriaceae bacterium]